MASRILRGLSTVAAIPGAVVPDTVRFVRTAETVKLVRACAQQCIPGTGFVVSQKEMENLAQQLNRQGCDGLSVVKTLLAAAEQTKAGDTPLAYEPFNTVVRKFTGPDLLIKPRPS